MDFIFASHQLGSGNYRTRLRGIRLMAEAQKGAWGIIQYGPVPNRYMCHLAHIRAELSFQTAQDVPNWGSGVGYGRVSSRTRAEKLWKDSSRKPNSADCESRSNSDYGG